MKAHTFQNRVLRATSRRAQVRQGLLALCGLAIVAASAIVAKELTARNALGSSPLAMLDAAEAFPAPVGDGEFAGVNAGVIDPLVEVADIADQAEAPGQPDLTRYEADTSVRWFDGRPVRPVRTIWMTVTAYSPDWRSCGDSADDITASNHHVQTNGFQLVAADSRVLPLGSMITIPGYATDQIVPVLDRGGKIKGNRLDLLFPTHEQARAWGVKKLRIVVWGYADGKGNDWRRVRDGK